ncbi:bifunctional DNA-binding transcriptional regulator/O6-methylguanine-DNA methyltransferase Ada [Planctomicrobium sp. SH668]|uniref:bifunctional DNA-binding transcriptional regulator/O6-methylguanine-DNA methyltransferase Ada n=1 Tax=Planctomicrobium sp. SH668 TaxID=3448126 RepID=UPI003F5BC385
MPPTPPSNSLPFGSDEECWNAVLQRDPSADGEFYFAVTTTRIFCRASCPARRPLRRNVRFYRTWQLAKADGFRACLRCTPESMSISQRNEELVIRICRDLELAEKRPTLNSLADKFSMSPFHLQRMFKAATGRSPIQYFNFIRIEKIKQRLPQSVSVTRSIYESGFQANSRFYEQAKQALGMKPTVARRRGAGMKIQYAVNDCFLGRVLIATTELGTCAILIGDRDQELIDDLKSRFCQAEIISATEDDQRSIRAVLKAVENLTPPFNLPLDIRGTLFQQQVWAALRDIPAGKTVTYTELAQQIGKPASVRAVAAACAANPLAIAIPCHRVVRANGSLAGYRWGIERKQKLIKMEQQRESPCPRE